MRLVATLLLTPLLRWISSCHLPVQLAHEGGQASSNQVGCDDRQYLHGSAVGQANPAEADGPKDKHYQGGDDQMADALGRPAAIIAALEVNDTPDDNGAHDDESQEASERLDAAECLGEVSPPEEGEADHDGQADCDDQVGQVLLGDAHDGISFRIVSV